MTIYKVKYWTWQNKSRGGIEYLEQEEEIIIDNLDTAKSVYDNFKNKCQQYYGYKGCHGRCQLFIPHIFENGSLAYWPDNEIYIDKYEFD